MTAPTLFASWRSPQSRLIHPVGRILFNSERQLYEFAYIQNVAKAEAEGFRPFLEFPNKNQVYASSKPFPLLANRLMPSSRPEFPSFLASLGLSKDAHPMAILARTGGRRETDQIELFPMPVPDGASGCYATYCLVRSIRYLPAPTTEGRIAKLEGGERLFAMADFQNAVDPNAIALRTEDNHLIGYLPAYLTGDVWKLSDHCKEMNVIVDRVNPPPAEVHHRLLVRVEACWPENFRPFDEPAFRPIVT